MCIGPAGAKQPGFIGATLVHTKRGAGTSGCITKEREAKAQMYIGGYTADRCCKVSSEWAPGLGNLLAVSNSDLSPLEPVAANWDCHCPGNMGVTLPWCFALPGTQLNARESCKTTCCSLGLVLVIIRL